MPVGRTVSSFCMDQLWTHPEEMHRRCGGRFLHHVTGEGSSRVRYRAICSCPCHTLTRAQIPAFVPLTNQSNLFKEASRK
jgi:hypothetical protein